MSKKGTGSRVVNYTSLSALAKGSTFYSKIKDSGDNPFKINIPKAAILIQLKKVLDDDTMSLLLKTDFFGTNLLSVNTQMIVRAKTILFRCDEAGSTLCQEALPSKIKLLDLMIMNYSWDLRLWPHLSLLLRLHFPQRVWRFDGAFVPPLVTGRI